MSKVGGFDELEGMNESSLQEILMDLIDGEKNLDLKSHVNKPKKMTGLVILSDFLKVNQCRDSSKIISKFSQQFLRYMVSFNRKSRTEITEAISSALDREVDAKYRDK